MAKLPRGGVSLASVAWDREVLEEILDHLKGEHAIELNLTDNDKQRIRNRNCLINGAFLQAKDAVEGSDVAQIIKSTQSSLDTIITVLSRPEQGLQVIRNDRMEAALRIANALEGHETNASSSLRDDRPWYLSPDEDIVLPPSPLDDDRIASLLSLSRVVKDACKRALAELQGIRGKPGAPPYDWYDEFVQLLLELSRIADIDPVVNTDRISGERVGPFIELALAFEQLLLLYDPPTGPSVNMRSPSRHACAKRLERSLKRLGEA